MSDGMDFTMKATGSGVMDFLDYVVKKGYVKTPTGQAMKTATKEVLQATEGDGWESVELESLEVEDVLRRFETLRAMKFSSTSLSTYKSRFLKAVGMFDEFRKNPSGWKPDIRARNRVVDGGRKSDSAGTPADGGGVMRHSVQTQQASNVITYPFPVREGVLASIQLPADLTKREAKRLAGFIESVAVEEQAALASGSDD
jgi:hypothetical protein